jgi:hypothetical protein
MPAAKSRSLADPRHLMRFLKAKAGADPKTIARQEGVSIETVKHSVTMIDAYRKRNTQPELDIAVRDLVISAIPQAKDTLNGLLTAMELVEFKDVQTGKTKVKTVEDKTTRLEALRLVNTLIIGLQPKAPPTQVNVNQTNQVANLTEGVETVEERTARLRERIKSHNALPPEVAAVPASIDEADDDESEEDDDEEEDEEDE